MDSIHQTQDEGRSVGSERFDAYHRWLGIPRRQQPANHYRLLGLETFESDREVIREAADQRISHVRKYQLGEHQRLSQRILNELAAARACLLDSLQKANYDRELQRAMEPPWPVASSESIVAPPPLAAPPGSPDATDPDWTQVVTLAPLPPGTIGPLHVSPSGERAVASRSRWMQGLTLLLVYTIIIVAILLFCLRSWGLLPKLE
jgi:hypothetical protein